MKSIVAIVVVALVAVASGSENGNRNLMTDIIKGMIEVNRGKLTRINIPHVDLKEYGFVDQVNILGAQKFVLERLDAAGPLSVDIANATISLLELKVTALMDVNNIEIPEIGLVVNGIGYFLALFNDLWATAALDLSFNGLKPHLEDFSDLYIRLGSINATLTEIDNADSVNEIINRDLIGYLNDNLVPIAEANKAVIIAKINEILDGLESK